MKLKNKCNNLKYLALSKFLMCEYALVYKPVLCVYSGFDHNYGHISNQLNWLVSQVLVPEASYSGGSSDAKNYEIPTSQYCHFVKPPIILFYAPMLRKSCQDQRLTLWKDKMN